MGIQKKQHEQQLCHLWLFQIGNTFWFFGFLKHFSVLRVNVDNSKAVNSLTAGVAYIRVFIFY